MLVLSRKRDEGIVIAAGTPYETRITVAEIRGDKVRLGIEAPTDVSVNRDEVQMAIDRQNKIPTFASKLDPKTEDEIREVHSLCERIKRYPELIETLQLRTVATNRLEAVGPDGRLGKALHRFLELMDKLQGV
jgi:carbon storage regulator